MGAYKRNDPELQEEESAVLAPSGKRAAPKVERSTLQGEVRKHRAPRKRKLRSWDNIPKRES
jgi:hypothetical protein